MVLTPLLVIRLEQAHSISRYGQGRRWSFNRRLGNRAAARLGQQGRNYARHNPPRRGRVRAQAAASVCGWQERGDTLVGEGLARYYAGGRRGWY